METIPIRASGLGTMFDCGLRWSAIHIDRRPMASTAGAIIGHGVHAGTALFDQCRISGSPCSVDDAVATAVDSMRARERIEGVRWTLRGPSPAQAEKTAQVVTRVYCEKIAPGEDYQAVELAAKPLEVAAGGVIIRLTGHLDRTRIRRGTARGRLGVVDLKTGRAAVVRGVAKTAAHKPQFGVYEVLAAHTLGVPVEDDGEVIGLNTVGRFNTGRGVVRGARATLFGDGTRPGLLAIAGRMLRTGIFPANPSTFLCHKSLCPVFGSCTYARRRR